MSEHIKETGRVDGDGHVGSQESMSSSRKEVRDFIHTHFRFVEVDN